MTAVDEASSHRVVTLAGHVDHGKSTLLRALTGMSLDRLDEEHLRGRTIELGFVWTDLVGPGDDLRHDTDHPGPAKVAFVDVPGHAQLVGTMIAGSGVSPGSLLVVAADDGFSVQSAEHCDVLTLLDVPGLAVVLTKMDRVAPNRMDAVEHEVRRALRGSTFDGAPIIRVDATRAVGLRELRAVLLERLRSLPAPRSDRTARLWVDRSFTMSGAGTVVTGTLSDGSLRRGETVRILPSGDRSRVRRLQQLGSDVEVAGPGTRVAVNLSGLHRDRVRRGDIMIVWDESSSSTSETTTTVDVWLRTLVPYEVASAGSFRLHVGTTARTCRVRLLAGVIPSKGEGPVRLVLDGPLSVRVGDRFVLRDTGRRMTVGGGMVIDPIPLPVRGAAARARHADALRRAAGESDRSIRADDAWLSLGPGARRTVDVATWTGLRADEFDHVVQIGPWTVDGAALDRHTASLQDAAGSSTRSEALAALAREGVSPQLASAILERAVAEGGIALDGERIVPQEAGDQASSERRSRSQFLVERFLATPFDPPELIEVSRELGVDHPDRQRLVNAGELVRVGVITFAGAAIERAVEILFALEQQSGPFTASEARTALSSTRRVTIPLLEHLVRTGRTAFDGQRHSVRTR